MLARGGLRIFDVPKGLGRGLSGRQLFRLKRADGQSAFINIAYVVRAVAPVAATDAAI
jgi:hypothetical protein